MFLEYWKSELTKAIDGTEYRSLYRRRGETIKQAEGYNTIGFFCSGNGVENYYGDKPNREITIQGKVRQNGDRFTLKIKCSERQYGNIMCYLRDGKWGYI